MAFWESHVHARANAVARATARTRERERLQKPYIQKQTVDVVKVIPLECISEHFGTKFHKFSCRRSLRTRWRGISGCAEVVAFLSLSCLVMGSLG